MTTTTKTSGSTAAVPVAATVGVGPTATKPKATQTGAETQPATKVNGEAKAHTEVEIKLAISPEAVKRLVAARWLKALQNGRATTRSLNATYFDTPNLRLRKNGFRLRIRREGGTDIQCLKADAPIIDGPFARKEWETPVRGRTPNVAELHKIPGLRAILDVEAAATLQPAFETRVRRTTRKLVSKSGDEVALDMDVGEIVYGTQSEPIHELEIELTAGSPQFLFDVVSQVLDTVPAHIAQSSKADRGFALADGKPAQWSKAPPLELAADASVETTLIAGVSWCLDQLNANKACALADTHPEGIHQMRVALRRLRSIFTVYKNILPAEQLTPLVTDAKALLSAMGGARDLDVFRDEIAEPLTRALPEDPSLIRLGTIVASARADAYEEARAAIQSRRFTELQIRLAAWMQAHEWRNQRVSETSAMLFRSAKDLAEQTLSRRHQRLRKAGKHLETMSTEERHDLRIDVKKLRYATEIFGSLYGRRSVRRYLASLARLQDYLGILNDIDVAKRLVGQLAQAATPDERESLAQAGGMIIGWHQRGAIEREQELFRGWAAFKKSVPFWS